MRVRAKRRVRGAVGVPSVVLAALAALAALVVASCGGGFAAEPNPGELYPDRANQFREDQERRIGEAALLAGYTTTVTDASYEGDGVVVVDVRIENRDDEPQTMFATDWRLVSPDLTVYEPRSSTLPSTGEVAEEPVEGEVRFVVDEAAVTGDFYIVYKPDNLDAARGIWQLRVD